MKAHEAKRDPGAAFGAAHGWAAGDRWKTRYDQIFVVTEVLDDGAAMLQMIYPIRTRPMKQKPIPLGWVKQPNDQALRPGANE